MRYLICATIVLSLVLLACNRSAAETKYLVKDLGVLPGYTSGHATGVNSKGQVVGVCRTMRVKQGRSELVMVPFLWESGRMREVKMPEGADKVSTGAINDSAQFLMESAAITYTYFKRKVRRIAVETGYEEVRLDDINNKGQMVGAYQFGRPDSQVFVMLADEITRIPLPLEFTCIEKMAIDEEGRVAVTVGCPNGDKASFEWKDGKVTPLTGLTTRQAIVDISSDAILARDLADERSIFVIRGAKRTDLKLLAGMAPVTVDRINARGQSIGTCTTEVRTDRAVVWDRAGNPQLLPTLGGDNSQAGDINDAGVIVGSAQDLAGKIHAVMWTPAK